MSILVVDTGSSSIRAIIFDRTGKPLSQCSRKIRMAAGATGVCTLSARLFKDLLIDVCREASSASRKDDIRIEAISLTSQRSSVLALGDGTDPLDDSIMMWHDTRSSKICESINDRYADLIYGTAGSHLTPVMSAPKMLYLKQSDPDLYERARKLVGIHDYFLGLVTGEALTDVSLASRTCLLDIKKLEWSNELLDIFGLDREKLLPLLRPGDIAGHVCQSFSEATGLSPETIVVTAGGDQQCSVLGQGISDTGILGVNIGSGAYACTVSDRPVFDEKRRVNINAAVTRGQWIIEANSQSSGIVYDWFRRIAYSECDDYTKIDSDVASAPIGANGILMLPCLSGKGCPEWDPLARGVFGNISTNATRADFSRAMLEGIVFEIVDCCEAVIDVAGNHKPTVNVCGGFSRFDTFDRALADALAMEINVNPNSEMTALGAWALAMTAIKAASTPYQALELVQTSPFRHIDPDPANHEKYRSINEKRRILYRSIPFSSF